MRLASSSFLLAVTLTTSFTAGATAQVAIHVDTGYAAESQRVPCVFLPTTSGTVGDADITFGQVTAFSGDLAGLTPSTHAVVIDADVSGATVGEDFVCNIYTTTSYADGVLRLYREPAILRDPGDPESFRSFQVILIATVTGFGMRLHQDLCPAAEDGVLWADLEFTGGEEIDLVGVGRHGTLSGTWCRVAPVGESDCNQCALGNFAVSEFTITLEEPVDADGPTWSRIKRLGVGP